MTVVRSLTLASLVGALVPTLSAADITGTVTGDENDLVLVDGFGIEPLGHLISPDGAVSLHPKALAGIGYDSNVFATQTNVKGSTYADLVAGLDLKWVPSQQDKMLLSGEFEGQRYFSQTGRNLAGGKGLFSYRHTAQLWDAGGTASASRTNDPFVVTGQEIKHDNADVALDGTRHWLYDSISLGATFDRLRYLEGAPGVFGKDDRNFNTYGVNVRVGHEVGDQSEVFVSGFLDHRTYDQNTFSQPLIIPGTAISTTHGYNNSTGLGAVIGLKAKIGTRSGLIVEGGVNYRKYTDVFAGDANFDDKSVLVPAVTLAYRWNWEEGSYLTARAFSEIQDSVFANAAWMYGVSLDARYRLLEKAAIFGGVAGYQLRDSGGPKTPVEPDVEVRTTGEVSAGAEYILHRGIGLRVRDVFDDSHSRYFNTFHRDTILAEIGFVY